LRNHVAIARGSFAAFGAFQWNQTTMKLSLLVLAILFSGLTVYGQDCVSPEDKALLEKLSRDRSFTVIDRDGPGWLDRINGPKRTLYQAYVEKSLGIVKVFKRQRAGWEGQYTMTWFTVLSGKITIVEAYFGDPFGPNELQYVHQYAPDKITLGYFDKSWECVPLPASGIPKTAELCIGYNVSSEPTMKIF
jgi:hypothetical protein